MTDILSAEGHLTFEGALTMRTVTSNLARLKQAVAQHEVTLVDCHGAEEVDLTFVQLLIAARKTAERSNKKISLAGPAKGEVFDTLTRAGFTIHSDSAESFWFGEGA